MPSSKSRVIDSAQTQSNDGAVMVKRHQAEFGSFFNLPSNTVLYRGCAGLTGVNRHLGRAMAMDLEGW
jgi:hypothetical protein